MITKTKIGISALILASFIIGGFAFSAYQAGAFGGGRFGFFRGARLPDGQGCDLAGLEKDSPEWQAKMEECKAKMEEFRANRTENGEWGNRGLGFGPFFGFRGLKGFADKVDYKIENLDNGIQITITSTDPDIVKKLQESAARFNSANQ